MEDILSLENTDTPLLGNVGISNTVPFVEFSSDEPGEKYKNVIHTNEYIVNTFICCIVLHTSYIAVLS